MVKQNQDEIAKLITEQKAPIKENAQREGSRGGGYNGKHSY